MKYFSNFCHRTKIFLQIWPNFSFCYLNFFPLLAMFLTITRTPKIRPAKWRFIIKKKWFTGNKSDPSGSGAMMNVFNRKAKRLQRNRAALKENSDEYDYLKDEVARRLVDRLEDVSRGFPLVLDLGCGKGHVGKYLTTKHVGSLVQCDMSEEMAKRCSVPADIPTRKLVVDEEYLPFKPNTFDAVLSSLSLHWVNDLPGVFNQVKACLKEDGMFLAGLFGGQTLFELRCALQLAELEQEGGFGPHVSPFTEMQDIGRLASQAGFHIITVDSEEIIVNYPSMFELMDDLRGMGENNASLSRKHVLHPKTAEVASRIYREMYADDSGHIPATFYVLFLIGWKPSASSKKQAKPSKAEIGTFSLKDIDKLDFDKK